MKFPNAAKGLKKIFNAEILYLFSIVFLGIGMTIALIVSEDESQLSDALGITMLIGLIAGAVMMAIALILKIVGVIQTAKDERSFKGVIYLTVFGLVITITAAAFFNNSVLNSISNTVSSVVSIITSVLIIFGICNMANQLGRQDIVQKGGKIFRIMIWLAILSIIMRFISIFLPKNIDDASNLAKVIVLCLSVMSILLSVVQYVLYISFLSKAKNMLN